MMESILEILVGQIPEAIYFALFLIFTKELKSKRLLFVAIITLEYVLLFHAFPNSIWEHILFFMTTFIVLKLLYKEKAQITDILTMGIASFGLMLISIVLYLPMKALNSNYLVYVITGRVFTFGILYAIRNKLPYIQRMYRKFWNRNDKIPKRMKTTTFRALSVVIFNAMFYAINIGLLLSLVLFWR